MCIQRKEYLYINLSTYLCIQGVSQKVSLSKGWVISSKTVFELKTTTYIHEILKTKLVFELKKLQARQYLQKCL